MFVPLTIYNTLEFSENIYSNENHIGVVEKIYEESFIVSIAKNNYYVILNDNERINEVVPGKEIKFSCTFSKVEKEMNTFYFFLKANRTEYYCYIDEFTIEDTIYTYRNSLFYSIIIQTSIYCQYAKYMLYGYVDTSNSHIKELVTNLGIVALFVISGMQISFFIKIIWNILNIFCKYKKFNFILSSTLLLYFIYLLYFPPPAIRAWLCSNLNFVINLNERKTNSNEILAISGIIFIFINPYMLFTTSLLLSYSITFFVNLISSLKMKKWKKIILFSSTSFIISMFIVSSFEEQFNLLAPLFTLIFGPLIDLLYIIIFFTFPFEIFYETLYYLLSGVTFLFESATYISIYITINPLIIYFLPILILWTYWGIKLLQPNFYYLLVFDFSTITIIYVISIF